MSDDWDIDEELLQRFESNWDGGGAESLKRFFSDTSDIAVARTLEEMALIDLELRWKRWSAQHSEDVSSSVDLESVAPSHHDYVRLYPVLIESGGAGRLADYQKELSKRYSGVIHDATEHQPVSFEDTKVHSESKPSSSSPTLPMKWGGYELIELLGQGAMGAVYRGRQKVANRDVALKRLRGVGGGVVSSEMYARFESEAHAAARLTSDYIVPLYDVGSVDGVPFYTMPIITGGTLSDLVRDHPLAPDRAAQFMRQVSLGLAVAHEADLLHRDIKPSNVLWDEKADRAMVSDFGLVRVEATESEMTQTGQLIGTPAYMSPEQARDARNIDHRSDIYSVGATLYHLLTGRPPFQASSVVELIRLVLFSDPVSLRRLNPSVPRDLEVICLQCLRKEPQRRYDSAKELADDLQRFQQGVPILARPVSPLERVARWANRNRGLSASLAAASLMALLAIASIFIGYANTLTQQKRYEAMYQEARGAVDEFYDSFSEDPLFSQPGMQTTRRRYLSKALEYYQRLLADRSADELSILDVADTRLRIGTLVSELETPKKALPLLQQALDDLEQIPTKEAETLAVMRTKGDVYNALGSNLLREGNNDEALEALWQARYYRDRVVNQAALTDWRSRRRLANVVMNQGAVYRVLGDLGRAQICQEQAQSIRSKLREQYPENMEISRDWAKGQYNLALLLAPSDPNAAIAALRSSIDVFSELAASLPHDLELQRRQIDALLELVMIAVTVPGDGGESDLVGTLSKARGLSATLRQEHRDVMAFTYQWFKVEMAAVEFDLALGQFERAEQTLSTARDALGDLPVDNLQSIWLQSSIDFYEARLYVDTDRSKQAIESLEKCAKGIERMLEIAPNDPRALKRKAFVEAALDQLSANDFAA